MCSVKDGQEHSRDGVSKLRMASRLISLAALFVASGSFPSISNVVLGTKAELERNSVDRELGPSGPNLEKYTAEAKADLIRDLPGFGPPKSNTFAGLDT